MLRNKKKQTGFTLIELLVVVAIIGLLAAIVMLAVQQARMKSRDAKRLGDITQMNTALELFFASNQGYPTGTNGVPQSISPQFASQIPTAPQPADGSCGAVHSNDACTQGDSNCNGVSENTYYYIATGTPIGGIYPDYEYFFCLGEQTGNFSAGPHILTPEGVR